MNIHQMKDNYTNGKIKCAEIYYHTSEFTIRCHCGLTTMEYNIFMLHFLEKHRSANNCVEQDLNIDADPLDIINITNEKNAIDETVAPTNNTLQKNENGKHLKEPEKECIVMMPVVDSNKRKNLLSICDLKNKTKLKPEMFAEQHDLTISEEQQNKNKDEDKFEKHEIDWSKPYAPNLLRNHDKRPYKPRNKLNTCSYCGRTFRRRNQLDTHLNIHTGLKPHQCEICGRQFRAVTTLTRHLTTHEQRDSFQCQHCDKNFTHRAAFVSHELRHTQQRNIPCTVCDKFFYTVNQMDTHKRKVHQKCNAEPPQPLPFACDICLKSYRSASMLSTHKLKQHYRLAKHTCEQCGKKFVDLERLESHKEIHIAASIDHNSHSPELKLKEI